MTLTSVSATSNTVNSLFRVFYRNAAASVVVNGGSYDSNTISDGALFDLTESENFLANEAPPSSFSDGEDFANFFVKNSATFDSNQGTIVTEATEPGPKTSCILITGQ